MLSYQHIYHAGNFADVHKHALLVKVLAALKARPGPLCFIDTHAGRGVYDFSSPEAEKKREFMNGIAALKGVAGIEDYIALTEKGGQSAYPGTAGIARDMLRPQDRMVLAELHPGEFAQLSKNFSGVKNARLEKKDGFEVMAANVPPAEKRGLVSIDPPYELKSDYADVPRHLLAAWKKWKQGVFFIWYPILTEAPHLKMLTALRKTEIKDVMVSEVRLKQMPGEGFAMYGAGVAVVNPPIPETAVRSVTDAIAAALPGQAKGDTFWLMNRKINPETGLI